MGDIRAHTHVFYSFLTLDQHPNPGKPNVANWDGLAIYDSMTAADIMDVLNTTSPNAPDNNWMRVRIEALIEACKQTQTKFIWSVGGWSDMTETLLPEQVDSFVSKAVALLEKYGDGMDFDWEHFS